MKGGAAHSAGLRRYFDKNLPVLIARYFEYLFEKDNTGDLGEREEAMRVAQSDGPHTGPSHGRAIEAIKLSPNDTCSSLSRLLQGHTSSDVYAMHLP